MVKLLNEELQVIREEMQDIISGNSSTDSDLATIANAIQALCYHIDQIHQKVGNK